MRWSLLSGGITMQLDSIRPTAQRLEQYFNWYLRADPDATSEAADLVSRFLQLVSGPASAQEAKLLLDKSGAFALGSAWEEMRAALRVMARA
ncbi:MAG: hypothetical protein IT380_30640 [Myxococcales bacterium]|nr:hypothetical protein [Myxococcales bacterium]